jgi:hypothetical protein
MVLWQQWVIITISCCLFHAYINKSIVQMDTSGVSQGLLTACLPGESALHDWPFQSKMALLGWWPPDQLIEAVNEYAESFH